MRRPFIVAAALAGLAACAPETIMASKDQAVIDAPSPGAAVSEAQRECARYDRKPYFLRSNRRTYWFLCLPKETNTTGLRNGGQAGLRERDRDRDRDYRDRDRRDERRREARPKPTARLAPPPAAAQQPRAMPGYAMGQVPVMPQQRGVMVAPPGYVASNQPMYVPNLQQGPAQMFAMQPPVMLAQPQAMVPISPAVIGSIVPATAPPVVEGNPDGRYWVQVGASPNRAQATSLGRRVLSGNTNLLGHRQVLLQPTQLAGRGTYFRIHLGPFANRGEAVTACGGLRQRNQACFPTTR